ncbi:MAG: hypothetical protein JST67_08660 [Bacteroidetes bacterium]|nr:hypothetical protein [Bacteroidota bacterium]
MPYLKTIALLFFLFFVAAIAKCNRYSLDSLNALAKKGTHDTDKIFNINLLAWDFFQNGFYDSALKKATLALSLSENIQYQEGKADAYNNLGVVYYSKSDYNQALQCFFNGYKIREDIDKKRANIKNTKALAAMLNNIGLIYWRLNNAAYALSYLKKGLKIRETTTDKKDIASSHNNIGNVYFDKGNAYLQNKDSLAAKKEYQEALAHYLVGFSLKKEVNDKRGITSSYSNIGLTYTRLASFENNKDSAYKNYQTALYYLNTNLSLRQQAKDTNGIAAAYNLISVVYTDLRQPEKALSFALKALSLSKSIPKKEIIKESYESLSDIYEQKKEYKKALEYRKLYSQLKDSIYNSSTNEQIMNYQEKYEYEKKSKEVLQLLRQNELQQIAIQSEKEKRYIQLSVLVLVLVLSFLVFLFLNYRNKTIQKAEIEREINHQEKIRFKEVLEAEDKERRRISSELHDSLGPLLSAIKLNLSASAGIPDKQINNSIHLIDHAVSEVRSISHNLMPGVLIQLGLLASVRDLVRKINDTGQIKITFESNFTETINEFSEVNLYRIIQEMINNTLKHAQATTLFITLEKTQNHLFMTISDDGIGLKSKTLNEKDGIGWKNIQSRTAFLKGTIEIMPALPTLKENIQKPGTQVCFIFENLFAENNIS